MRREPSINHMSSVSQQRKLGDLSCKLLAVGFFLAKRSWKDGTRLRSNVLLVLLRGYSLWVKEPGVYQANVYRWRTALNSVSTGNVCFVQQVSCLRCWGERQEGVRVLRNPALAFVRNVGLLAATEPSIFCLFVFVALILVDVLVRSFRRPGAQSRAPWGPRGGDQAGACSEAESGRATPPRARRSSCGVVTAQARRVPAAFAASARRRLPALASSFCLGPPWSRGPASQAARLSHKMTLKASERARAGATATGRSPISTWSTCCRSTIWPEVSGSRGPPTACGEGRSPTQVFAVRPSCPRGGVLTPGACADFWAPWLGTPRRL